MPVNVSKVKYRELNSQPQGRSGAKVMRKPGPAKGRGQGNPTSGGGIAKSTSSKYSGRR